MNRSRTDELLEIVNQKRKIEVTKLAEILKVSRVTVRKDLNALEEKGLLQRQHGYAIINNPDDLSYRLAQNYQVKLEIAKKAAELVKDQSIIMIESGSTCALLAQQLGKQGKKVTIITISYFIANYVAAYENLNVIVLGGAYQPSSQVVVGPLVRQTLQEFRVQQLFIGTDGFDLQMGFFGNDIMRTETVRSMAEKASELIILTDSSKFQKMGSIRQFTLAEVNQIYTDKEVPPAIKTGLESNNIQLHLV